MCEFNGLRQLTNLLAYIMKSQLDGPFVNPRTAHAFLRRETLSIRDGQPHFPVPNAAPTGGGGANPTSYVSRALRYRGGFLRVRELSAMLDFYGFPRRLRAKTQRRL